MTDTITRPKDIPASTTLTEWAAPRLLAVGFRPQDAKYLSPLHASALQSAMERAELTALAQPVPF